MTYFYQIDLIIDIFLPNLCHWWHFNQISVHKPDWNNDLTNFPNFDRWRHIIIIIIIFNSVQLQLHTELPNPNGRHYRNILFRTSDLSRPCRIPPSCASRPWLLTNVTLFVVPVYVKRCCWRIAVLRCSSFLSGWYVPRSYVAASEYNLTGLSFWPSELNPRLKKRSSACLPSSCNRLWPFFWWRLSTTHSFDSVVLS